MMKFKKFSSKEKYLYYLKRRDNKNISKKQRTYALRWLDGFNYGELSSSNKGKNPNIEKLKKQQKVNKRSDVSAYLNGYFTFKKNPKVDSIKWENEDYENNFWHKVWNG